MNRKNPGTLQLQSEEQRQVLLMLCTGFFMGVFLSTYQVTADSLFLNRLGEYLDKAFLIAGALGIMTTSLFTFFQNRIKFTTLVLVSGLLVFVFTISVYWLLHHGEPGWQTVLLFTMYCMTGPMTAVLLLSFWGIFGRLFNFRQSKRIIGWIDTGQLIAAIVATFSIPFTDKIIPDTSNYLLVCAVSVMIMFILMFVIASRFTIAKNDPREFGPQVRKQASLKKIFTDPYILLLSSFLLVSMIMFVFNQYSFQQLAKEQYPTERELTNFNAFFTGSVYGLSLLMQTFVNNKIISNYGLRISLFILPIVVGIFSLGSLITGGSLGFDKTDSPAGFIYFFLFISLSRLFNWTIRDSLENPVFKLFFIPLDNQVRFNVQTKVEGLVNESARFITGLLIFVLAFIPFFKIIHISIFLLILAGIYFVVVNRMYNGYRSKIRAKLESSDLQQDSLERGFKKVTTKLEEMLLAPSTSKAVFSFKLLEKINAANMAGWINNLMKNEEEGARQYAQERMNELQGLSVSDKYVIRLDGSTSGGNRNILSQNDLQMMIDNDGTITKARIQKLCRSSDPDDRHYAAELLLHTSRDECTSFLMELLLDNEPKVRNTAIKTSVKKNNAEIINALIENLGNPVYSNQAMNALVLIGSATLPALEAAFYRSGQNTQIMLRIIQVMGRVGGQRSKEMLWNKIDYPNKVVVLQVLLSLGECGFKAGISQITRIKYAIEADIADIRWNLSAIQEIGDEGFFAGQIKDSLRWEIQSDIDHIYMLLAMLYDTRSIQLVKENIESGTAEGITYAVELLDVFLSEQLKRRVIPVLDDLTDSERISRLDDFYPRVRLDSKLVLKFMINRDFTQANRWTKACVLFHIGTQQIADFKLDLIAQLFNPDALLCEISAWALFQIDADLYHEHISRLEASKKRTLDDLILHSKKMTVFEKVLFFQRIPVFEDIPGITLSYLADISTEIRIGKGESMTLDNSMNNDFYVIVTGSVQFYQRGELLATFKEGQFVGEMLSMPDFINTNLIVAQTDLITLKFNKDLFYELLADNVNLADKILEYI